jgi:RNA polymerase sigma-B factor
MVERGETRPDRQRTRDLLSRLPDASDTEREGLREELVVAHLNLVRFLAMKFVNRGEPLDDLIQVGTLGLLKAIDRFDTERGVEFTTYATPTIVGEIKRHIRDKGWAVKVPRRLQELNQSVNRSVDLLAIELGRSPTVAELAARLNASEEEILEAQELGQAYNLLSLDSEVGGDGDKKSQTLADTVGMTDAGMALLEDRANLERAFHVLTGRERVIIYLRFYESVSQTEIATRLQVSQMHVSRLQAKALEKLRGALGE